MSLRQRKRFAFELARALGSGRVFYVCPDGCGNPGKIDLKSSDPPICDMCHKPMIAHDRRAEALVVGL
jgi:hypothetical protein